MNQLSLFDLNAVTVAIAAEPEDNPPVPKPVAIRKASTRQQRQKALRLEINQNKLQVPPTVFQSGEAIFMTFPPQDEDYWLARVPLTRKQAMVCFPKFGQLGIGFQFEENWNLNLPLGCAAVSIYEYIKENKGDKRISKSKCIEAIEMLQRFGISLDKSVYSQPIKQLVFSQE